MLVTPVTVTVLVHISSSLKLVSQPRAAALLLFDKSGLIDL